MRCGAIAIVVTALSALVRAEILPIKAYTTADGLASDRISGIVADSRGFLWFSTPEGLSRFDGHRFVNYGAADGLPDRTVNAICEGRSGDRWIATSRGLGRIAADNRAAHITPVRLDDGDGSVVALAASRSREIWVATSTRVYEGIDSERFRRLDFALPPRVRFTAIAEDAGGRLWVGTNDGLVVLDGDRKVRTLTEIDGLPGRWVEMLLLDSKGDIWAALRGGLAEFRAGAHAPIALERAYSTTLVGSNVTAVSEASDGTIWVGTSRGISRLRWDHGDEPAVENVIREQGLSDRWITALAEDQAGNMWVGTESAGVMRIDRFGFVTYHEQDGLSSDRVWSVLEDRADQLLAVTIPQVRQGLESFDILGAGRFRRVAPRQVADNPPWGWNQILLQARNGEWWASTSLGVCRFDAVPAADLDRRPPRSCYARDVHAFSLFEDSQGRIWSSGQSVSGDRLMRWDAATDAFYQFPYPRIAAETTPQLAADLVTAFAEDRHDNIWMALYQGGLYRYDGRQFQKFDVRDGVPRGSILALLATESGLWIGSEHGGLGRIVNTDTAHPSVEVYNQPRGMSSDTIECLVEDRAGRIYAGTGQGVDRLDPATGHIRHFSTADGLGHGAFHGAARDASGALWFATTQGLSRLIPADDPSSVAPRMFITDLRVGGESYPVSPLGETRMTLPDLAPSRNQLQVGFVGLDYEPGSVVRYVYKLAGADARWSRPGDQQPVSYAALKPGTYQFLVKAITADGAESPAPAEVDFTVLAPVWRRWWFVSLMASAAAALVFAAHRYRVAHIVSLERMRTAIATDLHDDVGASLSQIAILSEVARLKGQGGEASESLERVAALARGLVDSMDDIVWAIRPQPDRWDSLVPHMREFALDVLGSQRIAFRLATPSTGGPSMSLRTRRQLFLMFKECIHNCARHARCTAVVAELATAGRDVTLTVEDNGIGSDDVDEPTRRGGGTGVSGMRRRAESLGGRMQITAAPGRGWRVEIHLPC
jgi:ligand-binding sensor domain-containing protein/signal transduction histidine kinase